MKLNNIQDLIDRVCSRKLYEFPEKNFPILLDDIKPFLVKNEFEWDVGQDMFGKIHDAMECFLYEDIIEEFGPPIEGPDCLKSFILTCIAHFCVETGIREYQPNLSDLDITKRVDFKRKFLFTTEKMYHIAAKNSVLLLYKAVKEGRTCVVHEMVHSIMEDMDSAGYFEEI